MPAWKVIEGNRAVRLSTDTARKMVRKHPDITPEVWGKLQVQLAKAEWRKSPRPKNPNQWRAEFAIDGKRFRAIVSLTSKGELYAQSLYRIDARGGPLPPRNIATSMKGNEMSHGLFHSSTI